MQNNSIGIRSLPENWASQDYDIFIATVGYERRARYIAERFEPKAKIQVACGFRDQRVLEYPNNSHFFESRGFDIEHRPDSEYQEWIRVVLDRLPADRRSLRLIIDISSVTRFRIATLLVLLREYRRASLTVSFVYSLAAFTPPPELAQANSHVGPVTPEFAGWWEEPDRALVAVVGLGYEEDKALGAVEHLQAAEVWTFVPESEVAAYSPALIDANRTLLEGVPPSQQLTYRVQDPLDCFAKLESLTFGLTQEKNPILLPFGPKIFSLCSLLIGLLNPSIPVWRVSAEGQEAPVNREASGFVYGLQVHLD
jgi:hypothetical protein